MSTDINSIGWLQGLYEVCSTAKHRVGTFRLTADGRGYRYAKAGAALTAGYATVAAQAAAVHVDEACPAVAVGVSQITLTVSAGTAIAEDQLAGGFLAIHDGGVQYLIDSNTAITSSGTSIIVTLDEAVRVALTTSNEFSLFANPWWEVTSSATDENLCTGVCPVVVADDLYFWSQTKGCATALIKGTPAVGSNLIYSPSGAIAVIAGSVAVDVPIVGTMFGSVGVEDDFGCVFLQID